MKKILLILIGAILFVLGMFAGSARSQLFGGFIAGGPSNTVFNVNTTSTQLVASGLQLGYLRIQNGVVGGGTDVSCSFGAGATSTWGLYLAFATSSPNSFFETKDVQLLARGVNCIGSSTLSVLKY